MICAMGTLGIILLAAGWVGIGVLRSIWTWICLVQALLGAGSPGL